MVQRLARVARRPGAGRAVLLHHGRPYLWRRSVGCAAALHGGEHVETGRGVQGHGPQLHGHGPWHGAPQALHLMGEVLVHAEAHGVREQRRVPAPILLLSAI